MELDTERDFLKWSAFLAKNAREGVVIENKILEWKMAEQRLKGTQTDEWQPESKAS